MANFKIGDKVKINNSEFQMNKLTAIIVRKYSNNAWTVCFPDGKEINYKSENLELIKSNKFSVGDKVWVTHKTKNRHFGWDPKMDDTVGKQFRVKIIYENNSGVALSNDWAYPVECLSHEDPNIDKPIFKIGSRVRVTEKQHMYYGAVGTITNIYTAVKETFEVTLDVPLNADVDKIYYCREIFELIFEDSSVINPQPIEIIPEEPSMSLTSVDVTKAVQVVPFIYGRDATVVTDEEIYKHIRKLEDDIAHYKSLKNQPKKLKARLESMQADIDALVKFVDERA
jgi:hypothetical protein